MKLTSTNIFLQVTKNLEVKGKDLDCTEDVEVFPSQILKLIPYQIGSMGTGIIKKNDYSVQQHFTAF